MPKPIARVSTTIRTSVVAYRDQHATVTIVTPAEDESGAHRAEAVRAAMAAAPEWCEEAQPGRVYIQRPKGANVAGGALQSRLTYRMQEVRDAAKAALRSLGYTVRAA